MTGIRSSFAIALSGSALSLANIAILPVERRVEALDKGVFFDRLGQIANCSVPQRSRTIALIGEGREEDERQAVSALEQVCLQLDAAHAGHLHVCNHTCGVIQVARPQEIFGRCERVNGMTERPQ
jgi:hypothetical protein